MSQIVLKELIKVYRFDIRMPNWKRHIAAADHIIAYRLYGGALHEMNGQILDFNKDTVLILNSEDLYTVTNNEYGDIGRRGGCIAMHFTTETPFDLRFSLYSCAAYPQMKNHFFQLLDEWNQFQSTNNPAAEYACISRFYAILSLLMRMKQADSQAPEPVHRIAEARTYLERNYANSMLSIADVAAGVNLSQRRINELFMKHYRDTPLKYLTSLRLRAAENLLRTTQLPVAEIAAMTGYSSASYFIRVFHREMGLSPAEYRKRIQE